MIADMILAMIRLNYLMKFRCIIGLENMVENVPPKKGKFVNFLNC